MANAKDAVETEALDKAITFDFRGDTFTVPQGKKWPLDVVEAQEEGKILGFTKNLLGAEQYKTLRKTTVTIEDLDEFVTALFEAVNVDAGK